jgi:hypothetical protein
VKALCTLLAVAIAWFSYRQCTDPIQHPPGVLVAAEPQQLESAAAEAFAHGDFQLKPLAHFSIEARVLHRRTYRDRGAKLSPIDLALGWGRMSDQEVLDRLKISQSSRFYWYEYQLPPPIPQDEIVRHSTNVHVIPADHAIERACRSLRAGELIRLEGVLVEATGPNMGAWRSSLRRDDTGNGACELLLVRSVVKLDPPAPQSATLAAR